MVKQTAWVGFYRNSGAATRIFSFSYNDASAAAAVQANLISQNRFVAMVKVEVTIPEPTPTVTATVEVV